MSYKLKKTYTSKQKSDFIVEYNHRQGLKIEETETAIYALEPWELLKDGQVIDDTENYKKELEKRKRETVDNLSMTAADVERAIYRAKGMDFDDLLNYISTSHPTGIDVKALKIELKANNFYRGNPYVNQIGAILGFTSSQLDEFFETKDYTKLLSTEEPKKETSSTGDASEASKNASAGFNISKATLAATPIKKSRKRKIEDTEIV